MGVEATLETDLDLNEENTVVVVEENTEATEAILEEVLMNLEEVVENGEAVEAVWICRINHVQAPQKISQTI